MKTVQHKQQGREITIDLNGNESLLTTKSGKPCVLRCHAVKICGEITHRIFSQEQVTKIRATSKWITTNDRDWIMRQKETAWKLVSPSEMLEILKANNTE